MVSSFLLHMQPAKVNRHSLRASYSLGLGLISLYLFLILIGTGVLLMFYYVPSTDHAYNVMKDLQFVVSAGLAHPQYAPLGGASDGAVRDAAHVPRVLHRRLQTPARIQLGARRRAVSADAGPEFHRLSAAVGPTRVLGDHRRHEHRRLRADHRSQAEISSCSAATSSGRRR